MHLIWSKPHLSAQQESPIAAMILWPFFAYFNVSWLMRRYRREWMSFYDAIHRTNNACETHNKMLRKAIGACRANIYSFIEAIARLEHNADLDFEAMIGGEDAKKARRWTSILTDRKIQALNKHLRDQIFHNMDETIMSFIDRAAILMFHDFEQHVEREVNDR